MFSNPDGGEILLFGGEDASGYLSDMWALDPEYIAPGQPQYTWKRVTSYGHVPVPRSGVSVAQDGGTAVVYGGMTENGPSDEVHLFDIRSRRWKRIETAYGGPSVRQEASIEYDPAKRIMYLYGGSDGAGCHNDLWDLDLSTGEWNRMIPDCTEGYVLTVIHGITRTFILIRPNLPATFLRMKIYSRPRLSIALSRSATAARDAGRSPAQHRSGTLFSGIFISRLLRISLFPVIIPLFCIKKTWKRMRR